MLLFTFPSYRDRYVDGAQANAQLYVNSVARTIGRGVGTADIDGVPGTQYGRTGYGYGNRGYGYGNRGYGIGNKGYGYGAYSGGYGY